MSLADVPLHYQSTMVHVPTYNHQLSTCFIKWGVRYMVHQISILNLSQGPAILLRYCVVFLSSYMQYLETNYDLFLCHPVSFIMYSSSFSLERERERECVCVCARACVLVSERDIFYISVSSNFIHCKFLSLFCYYKGNHIACTTVHTCKMFFLILSIHNK
jgi:hypothetical protein